MKKKNKIKKVKPNSFDIVAVAIAKYMREKGWSVLVIGEPRVQQSAGSLKYNFELVFRFTGKKQEIKKDEKGTKDKSVGDSK